jgi:deoxyadenosine/deoxycytidine kinase
MISKIVIDSSNESDVQSLIIQTEDKEKYRKKLHQQLDDWFDSVSDNSHLDITYTIEECFHLSA